MQFDTNKAGTAYPSESPETIPVYFYLPSPPPRDSGERYSNSGRPSVCLSVSSSVTLSCLRDNLSKHGWI